VSALLKGADPVAAARYLRTELRIGLDDSVRDILGLIETNVEIPVTVWPMPDKVAGAYGIKSDRAFIFVNSNQWPVRRRFTLAHEFGHHVLHGEGIVDSDADILGQTTTPREQQANAFAAEFLVPLVAVQNWMEREQPGAEVDLEVVVRLAAAFGVSARVARIRLEKARYLPRPADRKRLDEQIAEGAHTNLHRHLQLADYQDGLREEAIPRGSVRPPKEFWSYAVLSYQLGLASIEELAHSRRIDPAVLAAEFETAGITLFGDDDETLLVDDRDGNELE
jgi:Zn-dependent peptidase ImmA (M78 family)